MARTPNLVGSQHHVSDGCCDGLDIIWYYIDDIYIPRGIYVENIYLVLISIIFNLNFPIICWWVVWYLFSLSDLIIIKEGL